MRLISFALTAGQVLAREKTVTRRLGWRNLKAGTLLRGVRKAMGLKKGEKPETLAIIRVTSVRRERLDAIDQADVIREGFPRLTPAEFVAMFCAHMGCKPETEVTRIEFEYVATAITALPTGGVPMKTFFHHFVGSIDGMLRLKDHQLRGWCHGDDGRVLSPAEARAELRALQAQGREVIPYGGCDRQDSKGYCLGHAGR